MSGEKDPMEGVSLQTLTITAATPDVLGAVIKRITEETMKLVPDDTIKIIAKQVVEGKKVIVGRKGYQNNEVTWSSSEAANKAISEAFENDIKSAVAKIRETEEYKKSVIEVSLAASKLFLQEGLPRMAMNSFVTNQLGHQAASDNSDWMHKAIMNLQNVSREVASRLNISISI